MLPDHADDDVAPRRRPLGRFRAQDLARAMWISGVWTRYVPFCVCPSPLYSFPVPPTHYLSLRFFTFPHLFLRPARGSRALAHDTLVVRPRSMLSRLRQSIRPLADPVPLVFPYSARPACVRAPCIARRTPSLAAATAASRVHPSRVIIMLNTALPPRSRAACATYCPRSFRSPLSASIGAFGIPMILAYRPRHILPAPSPALACASPRLACSANPPSSDIPFINSACFRSV
ncbi:hypothetical protein C8R45DRAFT_1109571 [Mycena sanguinolenta]|nr:hypothetical protein C8R45DRAFT_1109571 [Mycena sanguinolenta]